MFVAAEHLSSILQSEEPSCVQGGLTSHDCMETPDVSPPAAVPGSNEKLVAGKGRDHTESVLSVAVVIPRQQRASL